jgi:hypothetical protein
MPVAFTRMIDANVPAEIKEQLPKDALSPEKVAPLPAALITDSAEDITGWTFAVGGDTVYTVTDPELDRSDTMAGGWTVDAVGDAIESLIKDRPRSKTEPGGLLHEIID